ncbi:MAG: hypothetical protein GXY71_00385 [Treponema sp.]|jgi:hypothetical protein|uniref:Uncharacterized protein n=1 Tax=uncultured Spirochaetota bacterium TaxID=460511 RepID=A0A652ZVM3_9SPIR|nr:hypothetical protein [Treponema sp.]VBB39848.1 hypothetical protein TRIP_E230031 [uncultured Spirochaetota bacterium]
MKRAHAVSRNAIKTIFLISFVALCATSVFGDFLWFKIRNPHSDVAHLLDRRLADEEKALVDITMAFYAVKYGYAKDGSPLKDAHKKMSDEEYKNAVSQAAKVCNSDAAKGFYRMGKAGEKLLKAIIQTIEDAAKATGEWIEKKSDEFDKKK